VTARLHRLTLVAAVGLAAADSAIVVLALPQLLSRFGKSIPSTAWVVTSYNLAAAIAAVVVVAAASWLRSRPLLITGLVLFAVGTIGCAAANSLALLVWLRTIQGVGGAFVLAGALAELGSRTWATAAAIGAAAGPALGGSLTEAFDWRAIFVFQAPVALAALAAGLRAESVPLRARGLGRPTATAGLALISGALVGALFLAVVLLVEGHGFSPLAAAGLVSLLPAAALVVRAAAPAAPVESGVVVLAAGLGLFAVAPGSLWLNGLALAGCGAGLGVCLPPSSEEAGLAGVASRHAGVVLGLLLLAPLLSDDLNHNADQAKSKGIGLVIRAPIPILTAIPLTIDLYRRLHASGHGKLPDFTGAFDKARRNDPGAADKLTVLEHELDDLQRNAITTSFRRPFGVAAVLALLALVPLGAGRVGSVVRQPA
jgi:MFS family permease